MSVTLTIPLWTKSEQFASSECQAARALAGYDVALLSFESGPIVRFG
jgi:hypothetical protein